jgi:biopolymer transport protein ExbD
MRIKRGTFAISEVDMTPMIDMAFQLISFFMFVMNFSGDLALEQVRLPVAEVARPVEEAQIEPLFLNVGKDGTVYLPGRELSFKDPNEAAEVRAYLRREADVIKLKMRVSGQEAPAGLDATVIIRADREVEYGVVQDLLRECRLAGFVTYSLRANLEAIAPK